MFIGKYAQCSLAAFVWIMSLVCVEQYICYDIFPLKLSLEFLSYTGINLFL